MDFEPKTKAQIQEEMLFPAGVYDFTVEEAEDTKSKAKGNDMIKAKLRVFGPDDREQILTDYLMAKPAMCLMKLVDFCESVGLASRYNAGSIDASTIEGRSGKVELKINLNEGTSFAPKNEVAQYVPGTPASRVAAPAAKGKPHVADKEDEDVPF